MTGEGRLALTGWNLPARARLVGVLLDAVQEVGIRRLGNPGQGTGRGHRHPRPSLGGRDRRRRRPPSRRPVCPRSPACCPLPRWPATYPVGSRMIVRRERRTRVRSSTRSRSTTAGATVPVATDTAAGQLAFLEARHRAHARVEDRRQSDQDRPGMGRFPPRIRDQPGLADVVMLAVDLIAWTQTCSSRRSAKAEPKKLRYQLLHPAARLARGQRRCWLRIRRSWPWATQVAAAFARLARCPSPPVDLCPTRRAAGATDRTARRQPRHSQRPQPLQRRSSSCPRDPADCSVNHRG